MVPREDKMVDDYIALQYQYPGQYVATRNYGVVAHAETLGELHRQLKAANTWTEDVIIQFVDPPDVVCIY
jgi:hypothetical protein